MDIQRHKRGQLSLEEMTFIEQSINSLSVEQIAQQLNRTTAPIKRYIKDKNLVSMSMTDQETMKANLRAQLHAREYWKDVQEQFTDNELVTFEETWIKLFLQFREDVLYAEELDLKKYITLEILQNRNLKQRQRATKDEERIQRALDTEYSKDDSIRDMAIITNLESQLSFTRTAIPAYITEYSKLLEKSQAITKDLKATRDQRIKKVEDSKGSWAGFIKILENEETRERLGDDIELMKLAKDKATQIFGEYHTYVDGSIDRPLLNTNTVDQGE